MANPYEDYSLTPSTGYEQVVNPGGGGDRPLPVVNPPPPTSNYQEPTLPSTPIDPTTDFIPMGALTKATALATKWAVESVGAAKITPFIVGMFHTNKSNLFSRAAALDFETTEAEMIAKGQLPSNYHENPAKHPEAANLWTLHWPYFRSPKGDVMMEVSDNTAYLEADKIAMVKKINLVDAYHDAPTYAGYPEIKNTTIQKDPLLKENQASISLNKNKPSNINVSLKPTTSDAKHEVQHNITFGGSSPTKERAALLDDMYLRFIKRRVDIGDTDQFHKEADELNKIIADNSSLGMWKSANADDLMRDLTSTFIIAPPSPSAIGNEVSSQLQYLRGEIIKRPSILNYLKVEHEKETFLNSYGKRGSSNYLKNPDEMFARTTEARGLLSDEERRMLPAWLMDDPYRPESKVPWRKIGTNNTFNQTIAAKEKATIESLSSPFTFREISNVEGGGRRLKHPIHLEDGSRISGTTSKDNNTFFGYDKNGKQFSITKDRLKALLNK